MKSNLKRYILMIEYNTETEESEYISEEIEEDKFKAYSYINDTNYGDYIGVYNSDTETISR